VKDWSPIQGAPLRTLADELEARRGGRRGFTRRPREASTPEEERIVRRAVAAAKAGDADAIRYLYLRYADNVYGYVRTIVRDDHEAEDITQHVFAKLMAAIHRYEPHGVPFSRWLLRMAHNAAVDHLRAARSTPVEEVRGADDPDDNASADRLRTLRTALSLVPDDQREVLVLRHIGGLSPTEIAQRMGRSTSAIHSLHHRGRGALVAALRDLGAAPVTLHHAA